MDNVPVCQGGLMNERRRRSWTRSALIVYALVVGVVVLSPVSFSGVIRRIDSFLRDSLGISGFGSGWIEFTANVAMFVPLGLLLTLSMRRAIVGAGLALVLSVCIELAQIALPSRQPTVRDVVANGVGAAVGAFIAWLILRRAPSPTKGDDSVSTKNSQRARKPLL